MDNQVKVFLRLSSNLTSLEWSKSDLRLSSYQNQTISWQIKSRNLLHLSSDQIRPSVSRGTKPDQAPLEWPNQTKHLSSGQIRPSVSRGTKSDQAPLEWPNQTKYLSSD